MTPRIQQDPAEGSREVINREIARQSAKDQGDAHDRLASPEQVRRMLGADDEVKLAKILSLQPTEAELEEALTWAGGAGEVLGAEERPLTGKAAQIFDIIAPEEEDESPG